LNQSRQAARQHGIGVQPEPGSVLYFQNADEDGNPYPESRHAGLPVQEGFKWISTLWIRQSDHDQWGAEGRLGDPS
jgi:hypothetical protein